ncbi:MAG: glycine oxidase ThiO [Polyangiaceae bacterium]|nr:glycine oxidase ThiO [Polyangiaceae bacterium]
MNNAKPKKPNVVIIGGGVVGCAAAWRLAKKGAQVTVLERSIPGAEASSAAAGILGAQVESHHPGPMAELSLKSRSYFSNWARDLLRETGVDIGYREGGVIRAAFSDKEGKKSQKEAVWQRKLGLKVAILRKRDLLQLEPELSPTLVAGLHYEGDARIDPVLFSRALHLAAQRAGVRFVSGAPVRTICEAEGKVTGVSLEDGQAVSANVVVVAAGSWTSQIGGLGIASDSVRPARGQIVELLHPERLLQRIVFGPNCYVVPRDDGRLLVGSTLEFAGYHKAVTAGAVAQLLTAAIALVPRVKDATLSQTWSNFRPFTEDELPLLGKGAIQGLVFASGHYRNGILLAPVSAEAVVSLVFGGKAPLDLAPFNPFRSHG